MTTRTVFAGMFVSPLVGQQLLQCLSHLGLRTASSPVLPFCVGNMSGQVRSGDIIDSMKPFQFKLIVIKTVPCPICIFRVWGSIYPLSNLFLPPSLSPRPCHKRNFNWFGICSISVKIIPENYKWETTPIWNRIEHVCKFLTQIEDKRLYSRWLA